MGGTAIRAIAAVTSVGGSELLRDKPFQPGGSNKIGASTFVPGASAVYGAGRLTGQKLPGDPVDNTAATGPGTVAAKPGMSEAEKTRLANQAASQRRKDYANLGRSSTILTGPGGLGGTGAGQQKTLLGY